MTITKRHKERFIYPAGIISLILLPILCICFLYKHKAFEITTAMEVNWWSESMSKYVVNNYKFNIHPDINFIEINLTGNDEDDTMKLDFAQLEIRQIIAIQDTTKGVHFHFKDEAKYWTLIRALDICDIENVRSYTPNDNDIWVFYLTTRPETKREDIEGIEL